MRFDIQKTLLLAVIAGVLVFVVFRRGARDSGPMYTSSDNVTMATSESFDSLTNSQSGVVLVDFYAEWCGPCHMQSHILKDLSEELGKKNCKIVVVDVDQSEILAAKYQVSSIPRLLMFRDGKIVWDHVGVASADEIRAHVDK